MHDTLQSKHCAQMLRCLGDIDRLRIIQCLRGGPLNVSEIADALGASLVNVSHHLKVLRQADLVLDEKHGRFVVYHLNPEHYQPSGSSAGVEHLNLGCCRLEIPKS